MSKDSKGAPPKESSGTRVVCPKCGSIRVRSGEEKGKVMTYMGGMPVYKRLWVCRDCGNQWG